ncbi:MAG TPA: DUF2851 family protein [Opitutaceae bacterium]|nr:DUF2851 family protein [Opitutaceae bacterium]
MTAAPAPPVPASGPGALAEIQGLYGPFSFPEKLFQKIWQRGDFAREAAVLDDGRRLRVLHPGKWNLLGGPDFRNARLRLGDEEIIGDVELHLHAGDWIAHRHADDPAYAGVVLHVVLFPPPPGAVTHGAGGRTIPALVLLPLLPHDLEEYAEEEAAEVLADRPLARAGEELAPLPPAELQELLCRCAAQRWRQKVHFARLRVQRLGWTAACHHAALEILGYRFNRAPMLRLASRFPLEMWSEGAIGAGLAFAAESGWSRQGTRPAGRPEIRLRQYAEWARLRPDWPARLEAMAADLPGGEVPALAPGDFRRRHGLGNRRVELADAICGASVIGPRFDNLCCDGFFPLLAARASRDLGELWHCWPAGDAPAHLLRALRELGVTGTRDHPACHGAFQGLLGWLIERERREMAEGGKRVTD